MKRICLLTVLLIAGCGGKGSFKPPSTSTVTIAITCPVGKICSEYQVYRLNGICPVVLEDSSGWSVVGRTTNSVFVDSNVSTGNVYSYDVETINGTLNSGPSNCITRIL